MKRADRVRVPVKVFEGIEAVRLSGLTNMLDVGEVMRIALEMGFSDAATWIENNMPSYGRAVFAGFEVMDERSVD